jgi:hypothetical protein
MKKHFKSGLIVEYKLAGIWRVALILLFSILQLLHGELAHYLKLKPIVAKDDLNSAIGIRKYAYLRLALL